MYNNVDLRHKIALPPVIMQARNYEQTYWDTGSSGENYVIVECALNTHPCGNNCRTMTKITN